MEGRDCEKNLANVTDLIGESAEELRICHENRDKTIAELKHLRGLLNRTREEFDGEKSSLRKKLEDCRGANDSDRTPKRFFSDGEVKTPVNDDPVGTIKRGNGGGKSGKSGKSGKNGGGERDLGAEEEMEELGGGGGDDGGDDEHRTAKADAATNAEADAEAGDERETTEKEKEGFFRRLLEESSRRACLTNLEVFALLFFYFVTSTIFVVCGACLRK